MEDTDIKNTSVVGDFVVVVVVGDFVVVVVMVVDLAVVGLLCAIEVNH